MNKGKDTKITLAMLKGKSLTTSVPTIAIKFHANAEELEDFYANDDDHTTITSNLQNETENSPLKYLPKLTKRSTSIDITTTTTTVTNNTDLQSSSPPPSSSSTDPWKFFAEIRGKITRSVEDKIIEIKTRNQEEGSPSKTKSDINVSDQEEISEGSVSKLTVDMSDEDEDEAENATRITPITADTTPAPPTSTPTSAQSAVRRRFRFLRSSSERSEGTVPTSSLTRLYEISTERIEQAVCEDADDIENGVEALDDATLASVDLTSVLSERYDNIDVDTDGTVNVHEVSGDDMRQHMASNEAADEDVRTFFAPTGFVDLRPIPQPYKSNYYWLAPASAAAIIFYMLIHSYSVYLSGIIMGVFVSTSIDYLTNYRDYFFSKKYDKNRIVEIPAVEEFHPLSKFEGWINELPIEYDPMTYHVSQTQSVYLKLQGNLLRVSHTRMKIPKRALWNETIIKPIFIQHRVYNLLNADIKLLPEGLASKRHWSKKYPISICLNEEQMVFDKKNITKLIDDDDDDDNEMMIKQKRTKRKLIRYHRKRKKSNLTESTIDEISSVSSASSAASSDADVEDIDGVDVDEGGVRFEDCLGTEGLEEQDEDTSKIVQDEKRTILYFFTRTHREKEDWFKRLKMATHYDAQLPPNELKLNNNQLNTNSNLLYKTTMYEEIYMHYMQTYLKPTPTIDASHQWLNALIGRILFDCFHDDEFTQRIKQRIERKLTAIKLPYFIEELLLTELKLGDTPPRLKHAKNPLLDERGLWIEMDLNWEGSIVVICQTKLNLMKLKKPQTSDNTTNPPTTITPDAELATKSAIYNSDVEDSAESSTDTELPTNQQDTQILPIGGPSNTGKKFIKMVDKIAESKLFKAASEMRYIKKAMEGVSNTDLRLKVELRGLDGTLVVNVPKPPTNRLWYGFKPLPTLVLSAQPIVGERNITFLKITRWIEKKLMLEFQKVLVIPNMEDISVPGMSSKLPENRFFNEL